MTRARDWRCWMSLPMPSRLTSRRPGSGSGGSPTRVGRADSIRGPGRQADPRGGAGRPAGPANRRCFDDLRIEVMGLVNGQF
jgi:hypothetical protein